MSGKREKDKLIAIWALNKLGWSFRRIARLRLPTSHHTVRRDYEKACELIDVGELPILAKSERALKITGLGSSKDMEYLHGKIHENSCGGGRRIRRHFSDGEREDAGG